MKKSLIDLSQHKEKKMNRDEIRIIVNVKEYYKENTSTKKKRTYLDNSTDKVRKKHKLAKLIE